MPHRFLSRPALLRWLLLFVCVAAAALSTGAHAQILLKKHGADSSAVVATPRVRAELVAQLPDGVAPGQPMQLGLLLQHEPGWHTYWKNPGDSGLPTQFSWTLPAGLQVGEPAWPVPQQLRVGPLLNYGYEGRVLLPLPLQADAGLQPDANGMVTVQLHASWLICRVECIPEEGDFRLQLPVRGSTALYAADFAQAQARQPQALPAAGHQLAALAGGARVQLRIAGLPAAVRGQTLDFYPESPETFQHAAELGRDWSQAWDGAVWTAELPLSDMRGPAPAELAVVLGLHGEDPHQPPAQAWRAVVPVATPWQAAELAPVSPALAAALAANQQAQAAPVPAAAPSLRAWAMALVGGLLGGLLLNLMPCVFPVLAIKLLGVVQHGPQAGARRASGLAYLAGVVLSFVALGGLLLGLRAAGEQLGWGFQLQSPAVVAALAALFTVLGLNLAGLFEFRSLVPQGLAQLHARHPVADALVSGIVAVAVASPCTAPFMGASLGFAVSMPTGQALAVFAALGVGMALPFVLISWAPALLRWLPRPGAWMDTFRRAMAFPMFATVVWLVWVLGQQSGIDGAAALLALLLALSALVWALNLRGRSRWALGGLALVLGAWLLLALGRHVVTPLPEPTQAAAPAAGGWAPWSEQQVQALNTAGRPVFVDFTAAWCVTCQFNKRTTLSDPAVLADFSARKVALLRADWTRRDPAITAALASLGRSGVPVYVLYAPGRAPQVLSELPSTDEVRAALAAL